jgi:DNA repair protein RecN (Recombination protein N)
MTIDDFGLIAHAELAFSDGLTVFSGETGSGKTMLLGALRFALGERAEADLVRGGTTRARVVLEIEPDAALRGVVAEMGAALADDDDVIVVRELASSGRSQARINGIAASASQLRTLGASLVDVIGQHAAQRLLAPAFALDAVDRFGGPELADARADVRRGHRELQAVREQLESVQDTDGRALAQIEFARFAAAEIDAAALDDGEDERLRERRDVLANAERIVTALGVASSALEDDGRGLDALGTAAGALVGIARFAPSLQALADALGALQSDVGEVAARLARERESVEVDPAELEAVLARLAIVERIKKKYGGTIAAVRGTRAQFDALIERDATRDERIAQLEHDAAALEGRLTNRARELSALRAAAARRLEAIVAGELGELAMPSARFTVRFEPLENIGPGGGERAELLLAPNPGEPERPLVKSASGGELSRVLLALIVALSERRDPTALVFDEIDAGIGGATAVAVGARLSKLAAHTQVVVVTHLAQIASLADVHYALRKRELRGTTLIEPETLGARQARVEEIARMLSGDANPVSLKHAATLVAAAHAG